MRPLVKFLPAYLKYFLSYSFLRFATLAFLGAIFRVVGPIARYRGQCWRRGLPYNTRQLLVRRLVKFLAAYLKYFLSYSFLRFATLAFSGAIFRVCHVTCVCVCPVYTHRGRSLPMFRYTSQQRQCLVRRGWVTFQDRSSNTYEF